MVSSCVLAGTSIYCDGVGETRICFTDFDDRYPSIGVNLRGPQTLNIPNCDPPAKFA